MFKMRFSFLAPEDVCEELKDGQWPDPSDCKSYFLCRGVGSQWGEQKREVCYTGKKSILFQSYISLCIGSYFDPNEKTCKWVGMDKVFFSSC
jgi:hypothetical protein